jgi:hypothetical protein
MDVIENSFAPINPDSTTPEGEENFGMFALYLKRNDADMAVKLLERNGFKPEDISLLAPQRNGARNFVYDQKNSLIQGAVIGAFIGAVVLGLAGLFFGAKGMFTTYPASSSLGLGFSPVSAAVAATIGMVLGAASGVLVGIGSPKSAAKRYGFYLKEGGIFLVVNLKY